MKQHYTEKRTINLGNFENKSIEYGLHDCDDAIESNELVEAVKSTLDNLEREVRLLKYREYLHQCAKNKLMSKDDILLELSKYGKDNVNNLTLEDLRIANAYSGGDK